MATPNLVLPPQAARLHRLPPFDADPDDDPNDPDDDPDD